MVRLILILFSLLIACAIRPDVQYTRSGSTAKRKENPTIQRKQTQQSRISKDNNLSSDELRTRFALELQKFVGAPYVWGGASPAGTDCSGMIRTVYHNVFGLDLPHNTNELYQLGIAITMEDLQLGDLLFFSEPYSSQVSHIGIYLDEGKFIHASLSAGVIISDLNSSWYANTFIGARRICDSLK